MKFLALLITLVFTTFLMDKDEVPSAKEGIAVVELFTSQGCSSCPSADRLLSEIINGADKKSDRIYGLSFHVPYWNYLGWEDRFSEKKYGLRQRAYANAFNTNRYTPQMIVNGKEEFVGSSRAKANEAIAIELSKKPTITVTISAKAENQKVLLNYRLEGELANTVMNFALVERGLSTNVARGENRGRTLKHDNVVRAFTSIKSIPNGQTSLKIPGDVDLAKAAIIVYVQNERLVVLGAGSVDFD